MSEFAPDVSPVATDAEVESILKRAEDHRWCADLAETLALCARVKADAKRIAKLREALKPFAEAAAEYDEEDTGGAFGGEWLDIHDAAHSEFTVGALRAAARALAETEQKGPTNDS